MTTSLALKGAVVLAAYLLGSVSFATLLVRVFHGKDVRNSGSGNAGATNVFRTAGGWLAASTLLLDVAKGVASVFVMKQLTADPRWIAAAGIAATVGHIFPVWFRFHGGKGAATALGGFALISPLAALSMAGVFVAVVAWTRYVSLGSITAACLLPVTIGLVFGARDADVVAAALTTLLVLFAHRRNISRLVNGTERRLGEKENTGG